MSSSVSPLPSKDAATANSSIRTTNSIGMSSCLTDPSSSSSAPGCLPGFAPAAAPPASASTATATATATAQSSGSAHVVYGSFYEYTYVSPRREIKYTGRQASMLPSNHPWHRADRARWFNLRKSGRVSAKEAELQKTEDKVNRCTKPVHSIAHVAMPKEAAADAVAAAVAKEEGGDDDRKRPAAEPATPDPPTTTAAAVDVEFAHANSLLVADSTHNKRRKIAAKTVFSSASKHQPRAVTAAACAAKSNETPAASKKKAAAAPTTTFRRPVGTNNEVWSGVPDEDIGVDWTGWSKKTFVRMCGESKGSRDSYWYTPKQHYKLRSHKEVKRFVEHLEDEGGNEDEAFQRFKGK